MKALCYLLLIGSANCLKLYKNETENNIDSVKHNMEINPLNHGQVDNTKEDIDEFG